MGVLRDRMGANESHFLATVFLGSGLLFLAITFVSSALTGGIMMAYEANPERMMDSGTYTFARALTYELVNVYGLRMAGVFMFSTCTLAIRIGIFPRWMSFLGYVLAIFLLLSIGRFGWAPLVFPLWTLVISVYVLIANFSAQPAFREDPRLHLQRDPIALSRVRTDCGQRSGHRTNCGISRKLFF